MSKAINEAELLGQYLSYLLQDLREADQMKKKGHYFKACEHILEVIFELYTDNSKDLDQMAIWENKVESIRYLVNDCEKLKGVDRDETRWRRAVAANRLARPLYRDIKKQLWVNCTLRDALSSRTSSKR